MATNPGIPDAEAAPARSGAVWLGISVLAAALLLNLDRLGFSPAHYLTTRRSFLLFQDLQLIGIGLVLPILVRRSSRAQALGDLFLRIVPIVPITLILSRVSGTGTDALVRSLGVLAALGLIGARTSLMRDRGQPVCVLAWLVVSILLPLLEYMGREHGASVAPGLARLSPFDLMDRLVRGVMAPARANLVVALLLLAGGLFFTLTARGIRRLARLGPAILLLLVPLLSATHLFATLLFASGESNTTLEIRHPLSGWVTPSGITGIAVRVTAGERGYDGWIEASADRRSAVREHWSLQPHEVREEVYLVALPGVPTRLRVTADGLPDSDVALRVPGAGQRLVGLVGLEAAWRSWVEEVLGACGIGGSDLVVNLDANPLPERSGACDGLDLLVLGPRVGAGTDEPVAAMRALLGAGAPFLAIGLPADAGDGGPVRASLGWSRGIRVPVPLPAGALVGEALRPLIREPERALEWAIVPPDPWFGLAARWTWEGAEASMLSGVVMLIGALGGFAYYVGRRRASRLRVSTAAAAACSVLVLAIWNPVPAPMRLCSGAIGMVDPGGSRAFLIERFRLLGLGDVQTAISVPRGTAVREVTGVGETPPRIVWTAAEELSANLELGSWQARTFDVRADLEIEMPPASTDPDGSAVRNPLPFSLDHAFWLSAGEARAIGRLEPGQVVRIDRDAGARPVEEVLGDAARGADEWVAAVLPRVARWAARLGPDQGVLLGLAPRPPLLETDSRPVGLLAHPTVWLIAAD